MGIPDYPALVAGQPVAGDDWLTVNDPWSGRPVGRVAMLGAGHLPRLLAAHAAPPPPLTRHQRSVILFRVAELVAARREAFAQAIRAETGLCIREATYEVGRAADVFRFAAIHALEDDCQAFAADVSPQGKARRIMTLREPLRLVYAITPFNHPLNQVAHKLAPALAVGAPVLLKPSEKTPIVALMLAALLFEAGLPGPYLSVFLGPIGTVVEPLLSDEAVELVTYTGGTAVGRRIAALAGYKRICLELGGHSPLLVLGDADPAFAAELAAEGCFRNSGQRCTAIRRILVERRLVPAFTAALADRLPEYAAGDPDDPATKVGTVISATAAAGLAGFVAEAVADGARLLAGGTAEGALFRPALLADVPRTARIAREEAFGPIAAIYPTDGLDDALALANATRYGLSSGVVTNDLAAATRCVRELRTGAVNVNDVPGFRTERSPFGGIGDSGLGIKEGVIEAAKFMTNVKTFSLPW